MCQYKKRITYYIDKKEIKRMAYNAKADRNYNANSKVIGLKYTPNQIAEYNRIKQYCTDNKLTLQGYIKELIKNDLDSKQIPYTPDASTQHDDI